MIVQVKNLTKKFKKFIAVDGISFSIQKGEIVGLLGPNGAGKTTIIHMLLDLITPTEGEISLFHKQLHNHHEEILEQLGFASPYILFPFRLTVFENLMVYAALYKIPYPKERIFELLELFQIADLHNTPAGKLSSGEFTRVGICKSLLHHPKFLLLDEPTASLDPEIARHTREILMKFNKNEKMTLLYTSHNMAEIERICDRIIFLNHGKIIAAGTPMEITQAILQEERKEPALEEVFLKIVKDTHYENS